MKRYCYVIIKFGLELTSPANYDFLSGRLRVGGGSGAMTSACGNYPSQKENIAAKRTRFVDSKSRPNLKEKLQAVSSSFKQFNPVVVENQRNR